MIRPLPLCQEYDPEMWFPVGSSGPAVTQTEQAKAICRACPLRAECLDFALRTNVEFGVWGGFSEDDRRVMRRRNPIPVRSINSDHRDRTPLVRALAS